MSMVSRGVMIRLNDLSDASTKPPSYRYGAWNVIRDRNLRWILEKELGLMLKESENVLDLFQIVLSVMISCPPRCPLAIKVKSQPASIILKTMGRNGASPKVCPIKISFCANGEKSFLCRKQIKPKFHHLARTYGYFSEISSCGAG